MSTRLETETKRAHVELAFSTNNDTTLIRAVIVFAEGVFKNESYVVYISVCIQVNHIYCLQMNNMFIFLLLLLVVCVSVTHLSTR